MKLRIDSIECGKLIIKVLTTNTTSVTLQNDEKFFGKVKQPGAVAAKTCAEHGLAMSLHVFDDDGSHLYLFDTGGMMNTIIENSKAFDLNLNNVEKLILSHGHYDHFGGMESVIPLLRKGAEIILNSKCFIPNQNIRTKSGEEIPAEELPDALEKYEKEGNLLINRRLPIFDKEKYLNLIEQYGVKLSEISEPLTLHKGIITSGEIELFEPAECTKGFYLVNENDRLTKHTFRDEISIYLNIKDKGLVVLTGCGHCGLINTIKHGQKLTGIDRIYAIIGGLHQERKKSEELQKTIEYIEKLNPDIVCGMHCTGFEFNKLMSRHPSHTQGIVGTEFHL